MDRRKRRAGKGGGELKEIRSLMDGLEERIGELSQELESLDQDPASVAEEPEWEETAGEAGEAEGGRFVASSRERAMQIDPVFQDLDDEQNIVRVTELDSRPRQGPSALFEELGKPKLMRRRVVERVAPMEEGVGVDLNPREAAEADIRRKKERLREDVTGSRSVVSAKVRAERPRRSREAPRQTAESPLLEELAPSQASSPGKHSPARPLKSATAEELELDDPFVSSQVTPSKTHLDIVMERRDRHRAAEERRERKEKEKAEWDYADPNDEAGGLRTKKKPPKFNLPLYLLKASAISVVGLLLVYGARSAYDGIRGLRKDETKVNASEAVALKEAIKEGAAEIQTGGKEAKKVVEKFLAAGTWQEKLRFARTPEIVGPKMEQFYRDRLQSDSAFSVTRITEFKHDPLPGGDAFVFRCELTDETEITVPVVRFTSEAADFRVDWESFVGYSDVDWAKFLAKLEPGAEAVFRLYGSEDDYFAAAFPDSKKHACFLLKDHRETAAAYGYVEADGDLAKRLKDMVKIRRKKEGKELRQQDLRPWLPQPRVWPPMVLRVRHVARSGDSAFPQVEIVEVVSPNWIIAANASAP